MPNFWTPSGGLRGEILAAQGKRSQIDGRNRLTSRRASPAADDPLLHMLSDFRVGNDAFLGGGSYSSSCSDDQNPASKQAHNRQEAGPHREIQTNYIYVFAASQPPSLRRIHAYMELLLAHPDQAGRLLPRQRESDHDHHLYGADGFEGCQKATKNDPILFRSIHSGRPCERRQHSFCRAAGARDDSKRV